MVGGCFRIVEAESNVGERQDRRQSQPFEKGAAVLPMVAPVGYEQGSRRCQHDRLPGTVRIKAQRAQDKRQIYIIGGSIPVKQVGAKSTRIKGGELRRLERSARVQEPRGCDREQQRSCPPEFC